MEIDEAASRVLRRRWWLIVGCVLLALSAGVLLERTGDHARFGASARIVVAQNLPSDTTEAAALVGEARALVTSRSLVSAALRGAHVDRDVDAVIRHVSVRGLGSSTIIELAVTDPDARTAAAITQALAQQLTSARNQQQLGGLPTLLTEIDRQLDTLSQRRADVAARLVGLQSGAQQLQLLSRQAGLDREIEDLAAQRTRLVIDSASRPRAAIVDPVRPAAVHRSSHVAQTLAIAGLLGLVVGVGLAAAAEMARPSVPDPRRLARLLGGPLLGRVTRRDGTFTANADLPLVLRSAARRAGTPTVVLTGPLEPDRLADLAVRLDLALRDPAGPARPARPAARTDPAARADPAARGAQATGGGPPAGTDAAGSGAGTAGRPDHPAATDTAADDHQHAAVNGQVAVELADLASAGPERAGEPDSGPGARRPAAAGPVRVYDLASLAPDPATPPGLVVAAGGAVPLARIESVQDLLAATGWPLLGVVETPRASRVRGRSR